MKFFLDENIPKSIQGLLLNHGHQFVDVRDIEKRGVDDSSIFRMAQNENAVFITTDRDFFHTIPNLFPSHCGIIVITLSRPNRAGIEDKMMWILDNLNSLELHSKVILMRDNSILFFPRSKR